MKELAEIIESRPLFSEACHVMLKCFGSRAWELQEFSFNAPAFGSMYAVYRCNGRCFRVVWDGRDAAVSVEMSDGQKPSASLLWRDLAFAKDLSSLSSVEETVTNELASKA